MLITHLEKKGHGMSAFTSKRMKIASGPRRKLATLAACALGAVFAFGDGARAGDAASYTSSDFGGGSGFLTTVVGNINTGLSSVGGTVASVDITINEDMRLPDSGALTIGGTRTLGMLTIDGGGKTLSPGTSVKRRFLAVQNVENAHIKNLTITGGTVSESGHALGGGFAVLSAIPATGEVTLENVAITGNTIQSDAGNAFGGGVYHAGGGSLTFKNNVSVTGNRILGAGGGFDALGSAIYAATDHGDVALNFDADDVNSVIDISGNTINGSAPRKDGIYIGGTNASNAEVNVSGAGTVKLANGITANLTGLGGGDFSFAKTGSGRLEWDGVNAFTPGAGGDVAVSLDGGAVHLGKYFTVKADSAANYAVTITGNTKMSFDANRDESLAMFDFTGNYGNTNTMVVGNGTKTELSTGIIRSVYSYDKEYTVAAGLDTPTLNAVKNGFILKNSMPDYVTWGSGLKVEGDKLLASVNYRSPFDNNGPNAKAAQDSLDAILRDNDAVSDAEWVGLLGNARAAYPELFVDQAFVTMTATGTIARSAVEHGMRAPHLARIRSEVGYYPPAEKTGAYDDYGEPLGTGYYDAYPSLNDENCGLTIEAARGLRVWGEYIGDWRHMDAEGGFNGYKVDRNGFLLGFAYDWGNIASLGVYGGYTNSETNARHIDASVESDAGHLGITGRLSPLSNYPELSLYGDLGYHFASNDSNRTLGGFGANGSFSQDLFTAGLGIEYLLALGNNYIRPYADLRYAYLDQKGMSESGSSITAASIDGFDKSLTNTRIGLELTRDVLLCPGVLTPTLNVAWRHEYGVKQLSSAMRYHAGGSLFDITSSGIDKDSVDIGVGLRLRTMLGDTYKFGFNVAYNLNLSKNTTTHSAYGGFDLGF